VGEFNDPGLAYLGVRFTIPTDDVTHFGWIEISTAENQLTLTRLFWETGDTAAVTPGGGTVPEPGSLALLVAGAAGLLAIRRRQRQA
jgi:hypothetical protein